MRRWMIPLVALTLAVAFQASSAQAGLFSSHGGGHDTDCCPSCATPTDCYMQPTCAAPVECAPSCGIPATPSCATTGVYYDGCAGDVYYGGCYEECEQECRLKRAGRRLWHLEKRKNACLRRTFFGRCHRDDQCDDGYCAPHYYYQSNYGAACGCP